MPIYEYECEACGRLTEALQRVSDPPLAQCPHCEGKLRKCVSAPAFQFKGSGWYATDYAQKGGGRGEEKSSSEEKAKGAEKPAAAETSTGSGSNSPTAPAGGDKD